MLKSLGIDLAQHKLVKVVVYGLVLCGLVFGFSLTPFMADTAQAATCKDGAIIQHVQNTWNGQHEWKARVYTSPSNYGKHYKVTEIGGRNISRILTNQNLGTGSNYIDL